MDQQPTRSGKHREPREFDKTSLNTTDTYRITRDIIAHAFRYGFARRFINNTTSVLDVGCGVDLPLLKTLAGGYANAVPKSYVGVDLNRLKSPLKVSWATLHQQFNFVERHEELATDYDVIVCFEVLEHMLEGHQENFMRGLKRRLKKDGTLFLSTPVFHKKAAKNHVRELTIAELQALVDRVGLRTEKRFGTYASYHDLKRVITPEQLATLDALNEFYYFDLTACFLAPLYPDSARNNCWILKHAG